MNHLYKIQKYQLKIYLKESNDRPHIIVLSIINNIKKKITLYQL